jgi:hypothetical protein
MKVLNGPLMLIVLLGEIGCNNPGLGPIDQAGLPDMQLALHCTNSQRDSSESDVDCGGIDCAPCLDGRNCTIAGDCESGRCTAGACAASFILSLGEQYTLTDHPCATLADDFNNDGIVDLVVTDPDEAFILLGKGDGTFAQSQLIGEVLDACDGFAGDMNGDRNSDLVFPERQTGNVVIFFGEGSGTFQAPTKYATGSSYSSSVVILDENRDGLKDIIANRADAHLTILYGMGNNRFQEVAPVTIANIAADIVGADFNRNGQVDLAAIFLNDGVVSILSGRGQGQFQRTMDYRIGGDLIDPSAVDINGDKISDIVVTDAQANVLIVLIGRSDGSFQSAVRYSVGDRPYSAIVADLDNDTAEDLITANAAGGDLSILRNRGNGTFYPARSWGTFKLPVRAVAGYLNTDNLIDVVITSAYDDKVTILLNGFMP